MPRRLSWAMLFALALSVSFAAALLPTIDYPIGTAFDEHGKLGAVRTGNYHYYHPLLIIDLGQAAAFVVQPPDLPSLAHLVRMLSVVAGGVLVFATFILARLLLPDLPSLAAAAAAAATPLFTVHARLFKEDIFLACFLVLVLAALIRLLQEPTQRRAILLGLLVGLAAGSKYVGVLILPLRRHRHSARADARTGAAVAESRDCRRHLDRYLSPRHAAGDQTFRPLAERA